MIAMNTPVNAEHFAQEWALMRLAHLYAYAVDHGDPSVIEQIFEEDAVVEAPFKTFNGWPDLRGMCINIKKDFRSTLHCVHNQVVKIDGTNAQGETYCVAYHVMDPPRGGAATYDVGVVYRDRWRQQGGLWRFVSRYIQIQWTNVKQVRLEGEMYPARPQN